jgi:hypothetical protein
MSDALPSTAAGSSAEVQAAVFADDDRIHFSTETGTWRLEQEDGSELEYDTNKAQWFPVVSPHRCTVSTPISLKSIFSVQVDEELLRKQQAAYAVAGVDEEVRDPFPDISSLLNTYRPTRLRQHPFLNVSIRNGKNPRTTPHSPLYPVPPPSAARTMSPNPRAPKTLPSMSQISLLIPIRKRSSNGLGDLASLRKTTRASPR